MVSARIKPAGHYAESEQKLPSKPLASARSFDSSVVELEAEDRLDDRSINLDIEMLQPSSKVFDVAETRQDDGSVQRHQFDHEEEKDIPPQLLASARSFESSATMVGTEDRSPTLDIEMLQPSPEKVELTERVQCHRFDHEEKDLSPSSDPELPLQSLASARNFDGSAIYDSLDDGLKRSVIKMLQSEDLELTQKVGGVERHQSSHEDEEEYPQGPTTSRASSVYGVNGRLLDVVQEEFDRLDGAIAYL